MTAEFVPQSALALRLARIEAELDAMPLSDYLGQSESEARHNAAALRRIESRIATHVGAASRAVRAHHPTRAAQVISRSFGNNAGGVQREINDAETLAETSLTEQASANGLISHGHAKVIAKAIQ